MFLLSGTTHAMIDEPARLLLALAVFAAVAGFTVAGLHSHAGMDSFKSVRCGVRGAAVTAIVSASAFGVMARTVPGQFALFRALLAGILSVMPGMLCGTLAAGLGAILFSRPLPVEKPSPHGPDGLPESVVWGLRGLIATLVVLAVSLPPGEFPAAKLKPAIEEKPVQVIPQPPSFSYAASPAITTAHAMQWNLSTTHNLEGVKANTVTLSQDDRWLGYVSDHDAILRAVDLSSHSERHASLPHSIDRLAFSPDAERVFVATSREELQMGVVDLKTSRYISLPKPRNRAMPEGQLFWWQEKEVLILGNGGRWILNLDTLDVDAADEVASWKSADEARRSLITSQAAGGLRESPRWAWQSVLVPKSTELPEERGVSDWLIQGAMRLSIRHPERDVRRVFDLIAVEKRDRLLSTRDGSKVIQVRGDSARVFYFDITKSPSLKWTIPMPHPATEGPDSSRIETALKDGTLCAYVYGRVVNPLNQQLVGPDRRDVRGTLTVLDWDEKTMTVYLSETLGTVQVGDIVADLHIRNGDRRELVKLKTPHRWWAKLNQFVPESDEIEAIPTTAEKAKQFATVRDAERAATQAKDEADRKAREAEEARVRQERDAAMKRAEATNSTQPSNAGDPVKDFILAHHRKSEIGDARGIAADYAERVDYFTDGFVDPAYILRDETQYHATHRVEEESVQGDIRLTRLKNGYTATYTIKTRSLDLQKSTLKEGLFEENLIIIQSPTGLKIARQRAEKKP